MRLQIRFRQWNKKAWVIIPGSNDYPDDVEAGKAALRRVMQNNESTYAEGKIVDLDEPNRGNVWHEQNYNAGY